MGAVWERSGTFAARRHPHPPKISEYDGRAPAAASFGPRGGPGAWDLLRNIGMPKRREQLALWIVFLGYAAVVLLGATHHELWRDEVRALSLAKEGSLTDLFQQLRFEGHPAVWYLLLRAGYAATHSRLVLPGLSLIVAALAVYVLLRHSPFSWPQKILLAFGVFPLFEYSVVARNYGLGMLVLVVLATLYPRRLVIPLWWGALLALLANTSAHGAVIAAAIMVGTGWDFFAHMRRRRATGAVVVNARRVWIGAAIAIAGLAAARATVSTSKLPDWNGPMPGARTVVHQLGLAALNPGRDLGVLLPSPVAALNDSHGRLQRSAVQTIAIDAVLLIAVIAVWGDWSLLLILVTAVAGTGALFRTVYGAHVRHTGLLWFVLVLLAWQLLRRRAQGTQRPPPSLGRRTRAFAGALTIVMIFQAIEGVRRIRQDVILPWSAAPALAQLLQRPEFLGASVLGTSDYWLETEAYYSPNPMYFHNQRRFESHVNMTAPFFGDHSVSYLLAEADTVAEATNQPILLLLSDADLARASGADSIRLRARTEEIAALTQVIGDEAYRVFRLTNRDPAGATPRWPGSTAR